MSDANEPNALTDLVMQLQREVSGLRNEVTRLNDINAVRNLHFKYGYFIDQCRYDETVDLFGADADQFKRICIDFPKFADGRGYSAARLLREKYGYKGELRSTGDVLIDQLFFMKRCGFDTFALREDQVLEDAIAAFSTFTNPYQNDVQDQRPLFRRRQG